MYEILDLLKLLKQNYLVFIGAKSLNRLAMFISGYAYCIYKNKGENLCFFREFQEYIQNKYNIQTSQNWSRIIEFFSQTDEEAFDTFYKLLDEFLIENPNYIEKPNKD